MNNATREGRYRLLVRRPAMTASELPAMVQATEPLLREFLDLLSTLEADLAQRWIKTEGR
ncbi:hypothetical protein [Streptomyces sp.]|uniref:hypothetical protein n=1 Tax=Streptomyces sp. TaxID=1931 RepID=UPI002C28FBB2|nr:hypothetical protein [Streptomyces sp.]HLL34360.1 hypothetical protein [Streptomyces sp.]HZF87236.1 hypothetical protein [Streptomyces sp.]